MRTLVLSIAFAACFAAGGCSLLSPKTDYTPGPAGRDSNINDPSSINVLSWMLGGSVLFSSSSMAYFYAKRLKASKE